MPRALGIVRHLSIYFEMVEGKTQLVVSLNYIH